MAKQQVTKVEELQDDGLEVRPDFIPSTSKKRGVSEIPQGTQQIPRLLLSQGISPEVMDGLSTQGQFYHNIAEEALGQEIRIVPLLERWTYVLWSPRGTDDSNAPKIPLATANDGIHWEPANQTFDVVLKGGKKVQWTTKKTVKASGLDKWGSSDPDNKNSPPAASHTQIIFAVCPDRMDLGPFVIMLQRSFLTAGYKLSQKFQYGDYDVFAKYYVVSSWVDQNKKNEKFYNWKFRAGLWVKDAEEFELYSTLYEKFNNMTMSELDIKGADDSTDDRVTGDDDDTSDEDEEDNEY